MTKACGSMPCPLCGQGTRVLSKTHGVIRRRECSLGHRFNTEEVDQDVLKKLRAHQWGRRKTDYEQPEEST